VLGLGVLAAIFDEFSPRITIPLILLVVVFGVEQMYDIYHEGNEAAKKGLELIGSLATRSQLDELTQTIKIKRQESAINAAILRHKGPIGKALQKLHNELSETLVPTEHGFVIVNNHHAAVDNYVAFWRNLVNEQKRRKETNQPALTALVLHSCAIGIWEGQFFLDILIEQEEFLKHDGRIQRILGYRKNTLPDKFREVASKMVSIGIDVTCYDIEAMGSRGHNFSWDFLVVKEQNWAVIWKSDSSNQIAEAAYTTEPEYETEDLIETWNMINAKAVRFAADFQL